MTRDRWRICVNIPRCKKSTGGPNDRAGQLSLNRQALIKYYDGVEQPRGYSRDEIYFGGGIDRAIVSIFIFHNNHDDFRRVTRMEKPEGSLIRGSFPSWFSLVYALNYYCIRKKKKKNNVRSSWTPTDISIPVKTHRQWHTRICCKVLGASFSTRGRC